MKTRQFIAQYKTNRLILEDPLKGKVSRGRPRTEWMTNITEWTGMRNEDLVRLTGSTSGTMESHYSQPSSRRRHLMMIIVMMTKPT